MSAEHRVSIIGFIWRPEEITPSVIQMAHRTGSRAVFDFSMVGVEGLRSFLRKADPDGHVRDIRISVPTLMDPALGRLLKETGVQDLWVECHPQFFQGDPSIFLARLRELSENHRCFPIIGNLDLLAAILKGDSGIGRIVLKGCEASGFVSGETTLALYSVAKEMLRAPSQPLDILIWGGVSTPEAAAAFLSTGAAGIVFESVHWLTDLVAVDDVQRRRLSTLRLDSTDLLGLELQVPCRLFNKGNSRAFKEIKTIEDSLCGAGITEESRRSFVTEVQARGLHPLESRFNLDEVIPLGVEASFAASFVERFGAGTEEAVQAFMGQIQSLVLRAEAKKDCFLVSAAAGEMGTQYPFIQGAMSWITDVPEFASRVADAGGLPTIALGMMDAEALDRRLARLPEIMRGRPYAVNVISLAENPFREMHLAWIKKHRPPFVVIAGGDLSPLRELVECGTEVMYIAPDEALLGLALEGGVRYVICEGYEAGGHVGRHSTLTLAQMALDLKRRKPSLFRNCRVILAGGIFDRETAFMAAMLGADAIQMGTAYLATREIVEMGALTALYQQMILKSTPGGTVVSGRDTGLRVRSLRTPRMEAILSLERELAASRQDEVTFRTRMEEMAAGSLLTAARGVDGPGGPALDERDCLERGQFMSGACAGLIRESRNLQSFHHELAEGPLLLHQPVVGSIEKIPETPPSAVGRGLKQVASHRNAPERVAITGMSILNALGKSPEEIWAASLAMKSGITLVPPSRWDHERFYDPRPQVPDKTYCKVGAFLDFHVSRNELGIPPHDFRTMTEATKFTMWLADKAIRESGILDSDIPRERIGVLISQNSGETAGTLTDMIIRAHVHDILGAIKRAVDLTPDQESAIQREVKSGRKAPDDTTLLGRLNCAAAGFICNRYGFMGPSYSVSAACASSLVALYSAIQMIRSGIIDAAIVGGGEDNLTHLHFLEFSALGALYGLSGQERPAHEASRPFDAQRDGMVLGEGGGMIVIERESLARTRGALVHAFVTGMGASNNHLGMVESAGVTQEMAIRASFRDIPYGPDAVDLVECHATSTRQGDVEEVRALKAVFHSSKRVVLTSFKSQIGHTLGASGINSLIRGVTAMKAGVFPFTLNYMHPDPEIDLKGSALLIAQEPLEWTSRNGRPRRLQVNAFGFGGSNYVVQVEQSMDEADTILVLPAGEPGLDREKGAVTPTLQGLSFFRTQTDGRKCRMAVVAQSEKEALTVIERSAFPAESGITSPKALRSLAQQGIFIRPEDLPALPLAFVFPGQGSQYGGMARELYESFPVIREWMDRTADAADFDLLHLLFHDQEENLQKTRWQQPAMFAMEHAMARYLATLGIHPVAMAGHSLGELTALCLAGVYSPEDGFRIVNKRALCMDKAAAMNVDPGVMAAVDVPLDLLKDMTHGLEDIHIGNINSPLQVVLSGNTEGVKNLCKRLKDMGHRATLLRVSMAFHSPIMKVIHDELEAFVASIPFHCPQIPVISNTTMAPYPSDPDEIRRILMAHLESTVHWMNNVRTLWNDYGVRLFMEVGPGETLSNLIADTLPESACIQTCLPSAEGLTYKTALAQLFVQGHLKVEGEPRFVALSARGKTPVPPPPRVAAPGEAHEDQDLMERLIRIIMDATGFNRDEIQPEMDLRKDLSIRSSRLPIIMDAAERQFRITIELEDFIGVRTVKDIARRISKVIARHGSTGLESTAKAVDPDPVRDKTLKSSEDGASLKRLVFNHAALEWAASIPMELSPGESVLLLSPERDDGIAGDAGDILRTDYGVDTIPMPFMQGNFGPGKEGRVIRTDEGASRAADKMANLPPLSGMVVNLCQGCSGRVRSMADVSPSLRELFLLVKAFLQSPAKKFVVLIHSREDIETPVRLLTEGMLGLFLSAAQEYPSVQFRTLEIDRDTDLRAALRGALDRGCTVVEMIHHDGRVFTSEGRLAPLIFGDSSNLNLSPGDVVVMSGGATGISSHLARCLAPFAPRLVFLGRTQPGPGIHPANVDPEHSPSEAVPKVFTTMAPSPSPSLSRGEGCNVSPPLMGGDEGEGDGCGFANDRLSTLDPRALEIATTLADLHATGIDATYHACDVTDPEAVRAIISEVARRYGRIDGIIHGAGVLRDGPLSQMSPEDFTMVTNVKFLGAWNLFSAAEGAGLRFFVGLSSAAAIQGNPGQTNYAAANRVMSALLRTLRRKNGAVRFKALMLPPVEGAGMADNPEVRALMKRKGAAYIHVNELAGLFCRELFAAPDEDDWVMFMRRLPPVGTSLLKDICRPSPDGELDGGAVSFSPEDFPMIERITSLDIRREELEAFKSFSLEKDLWIADHRPFKFVKHALVSAAMVLETFMEAARILYPHLQVRGVRRVRLMNMIQCPPGVPRPARISCRRTGNGLREIWCEVSLATHEISPAGRSSERFTPHCKGQVILDGGNDGGGLPGKRFPDFPVRPDELRTRPMDHKKILKWYKNRSGLQGRYRVMEFLDGAGPGVVRGRTTYRETRDFANMRNPRYQYSPYLFEALLQLVGFHAAATDPSERRSMIPLEIGEMRFLRKCRRGEQVTIEARMRARDDEGLLWDARGIDDQGCTIMQIHGIRMHWVSQ
jgi:malonyl CoA-acyl carrier protein transacylase